MKIDDCKLVDLPTFNDRRGGLTFIENSEHIPFEMERVFYLYAVPSGEKRGAHAHKICHQFLIAVSGQLEVEVDDGTERRNLILDRPSFGLYIPPRIWASEVNFSSDAVCLVVASHRYDPDDYIRDYSEFKKISTNLR